jgi:hypothetical protein
MIQALRIFRKDVRHLWREILIVLLLISTYLWIEPKLWHPEELDTLGLAYFLPLLITLAWCLLIARFVQEDRLSGDRQFWITRPYRWPNLLTAKLYSLTLWVILPLFVVNLIFLLSTGFFSFTYFPALLFQHFQLVAVLILPMLAVAAVTESIGQFFIIILGILILFVLQIVIASLSGANHSITTEWFGDLCSCLVLFIGSSIVLLRQYQHRDTTTSRLILTGTVLLAFITSSHLAEKYIIKYQYPMTPDAPRPLTFNPSEVLLHSEEQIPRQEKWVTINIPVKVSNLTPDATVAVDEMQYSIETNDGKHWNSQWRSDAIYLSPQNNGEGILSLLFPRKFYDQIASSKVTLHISTALTLLRNAESYEIAIPKGSFQIPEIGSCFISFGSIRCLSPLRHPARVFVSTDWSGTPCFSNRSEKDEHFVPADTWATYLSPLPAEFSFSSVQTATYDLDNPANRKRVSLCPGTNVTFSSKKPTQRLQQVLTIPNLKLADYIHSTSVRLPQG